MGVTLGNYNDSMIFAFGLSNLPEGFDILNNPYISVVGYDYESHSISEKYEFEFCSTDYLSKFLQEE